MYLDPGSGGMLIQVIVALVVILLWIIPAVLVFRDAKKNKIDPPVLWAIVVFFAIIIGLVAYLIVRNLKRGKENESDTTKSNTDELLKYKELLDKGVITLDDYNTKKKQLLE